MSDHAWLDHIIHTGELPHHFGKHSDLRTEIQTAAREMEHVASGSPVRMPSGESAAPAGREVRTDSTRAPHAHGITGNAGGEVLG